MAGAKKKKKPAANPARGVATVSIASKPRPDVVSDAEEKASSEAAAATPRHGSGPSPPAPATNSTSGPTGPDPPSQGPSMTADEFEKQLEDSELQLLVERHGQKVKRDANRLRSRLETDRRLLRSQAEPINLSKWLPQDLLDHILNIIDAESRFSASSMSADNAATGKMPSEEDMILRLWTLRQTLATASFPLPRIEACLQHITDIAPNLPAAPRDSIWGLEEAFDWLARVCSLAELPQYDAKGRQALKDTPSNSPASSRPHTPKPQEIQNGRRPKLPNNAFANSQAGAASQPSKRATITYDIDIDPEDLVPQYLEAKSKLFELEFPEILNGGSPAPDDKLDADATIALLQAKLAKIEHDVLFDRFIADQQWKEKKILLEKQLAAFRRETKASLAQSAKKSAEILSTNAQQEHGDVSAEAERIASDILAEADDDEDLLTGLFDSLPQSEVDPESGKPQNVVSTTTGTRIVLQNFGSWSGVSPRRILEEACRSRDASVKIAYAIVSETPFLSRQSLEILWTKPQEAPLSDITSDVDVDTDPYRFCFTMVGIAAPDAIQSEAFIATYALFHIFSPSLKEERVNLRLPSTWRDLWVELAEARKYQLDSKDRLVVKSLRSMVRQRRDQELEDGVILQGAFRGRGAAKASQEAVENGVQDRAKQTSVNADALRALWSDKSSSRKFQEMLKSRMQLPMWQFRSQVLDAVDKNQVVIVCGETGCGKSTQVPSFLMEHELSQGRACRIYCTEPRRISAISLARRVSEELGENRGDLGTNRSLVGYSIRLESSTSRETRLVYATTGIVMRMLETSNELGEITHLILDEVHERSIDSDFLLIVLKRLLAQRKDLKVVLMSATVDADRFSKYLGEAPILNVPGRTFPVEVRYLEDAVELTGYSCTDSPTEKMIDLDEEAGDEEGDGPLSELSSSLTAYSAKTRATLSQMDEYHIEFDLVVQLVAQIATDESLSPYSRAILVFLPGIAEIRMLNDLLLGDARFSQDWLIYPLHSTIATEDQESAFVVPPPGLRKIVLATNIAETGITIPDVTCVIDTGKHREMRFDERRQLSRLIDTFISRVNAKQRRGRAGRVQNGLCFHLFTRFRHDKLMSSHQTPEMLRLSLQDLAIRVKMCNIGGIEETLGDALDPPSAKNIRRAIDALVDVRALTAYEQLTPLGRQLARLPLDVFLGKLILLGTIFKCLDMAITTAAMLSAKSPFSAPFGQRTQADKARMSFRRGDSDLLTMYNAYLSWKRVCRASGGAGKEFQFCRKNFLSQQTLANIEDLKGQLLNALAESGFLMLTDDERRALRSLRSGTAGGGRGRRQQHFFEVPRRVDVNSDNETVTCSVIGWSFYPKLLVRDMPGSKGLRNIGNNKSISLHPSSVNRGHTDIRWLSYYHIMQSKSIYHAHETTAVEPFAVALLCGDVRFDMYAGIIALDGNRGRFALPDWKSMLVVKVLRCRLRDLLARSFRLPGKLLTAQHQKWLDLWQRLFTMQESRDEKQSASAAFSAALVKA